MIRSRLNFQIYVVISASLAWRGAVALVLVLLLVVVLVLLLVAVMVFVLLLFCFFFCCLWLGFIILTPLFQKPVPGHPPHEQLILALFDTTV